MAARFEKLDSSVMESVIAGRDSTWATKWNAATRFISLLQISDTQRSKEIAIGSQLLRARVENDPHFEHIEDIYLQKDGKLVFKFKDAANRTVFLLKYS